MASNKGRDQWPEEDIVKLLDRLKKNLPSNDKRTFKTTQSRMDWRKVAFKGYSGEMCKLKWLDISRKIRKYRTLTELVREAKEHVKNSKKSKKLKKYPDMPKKPLGPYIRFFMENRLEYSQMHPKLRNHELTKVMSKKYKELPEAMKLKYTKDFLKEKQEFQEKLAQFRKDHSEPEQNSETSVVHKGSPSRAPKKFQRNRKNVKSSPKTYFSKFKFRGEPKEPPMNEAQKFQQDLWSTRHLKGLSVKDRMKEIGRRWQILPRSHKEYYKQQTEKLQKQYKVDLKHWLKSLSPEEYAAYCKSASGKRKIMNMYGSLDPKIIRKDVRSPSARTRQERLAQKQGLQAPGMASSETYGDRSHASRGSEEKKEHEAKAESSSSPDSSSSDEDDRSRSSSPLEDNSDSDSN